MQTPFFVNFVVMRLLGCGPQGGDKEGPEANSEEKAPGKVAGAGQLQGSSWKRGGGLGGWGERVEADWVTHAVPAEPKHGG